MSRLSCAVTLVVLCCAGCGAGSDQAEDGAPVVADGAAGRGGAAGPGGTAGGGMGRGGAGAAGAAGASTLGTECVAPSSKCEADALMVCISGQFVLAAKCGPGLCNNAGARCDLCQKGAVRCQGDQLEACLDGEAFSPQETCAPGTCVSGLKKCGACKPGSLACAGAAVVACDSEGVVKAPIACSGAQSVCVAGACVQCSMDSHCPASSSFCLASVCSGNVCKAVPRPLGFVVSAQVPHDCRRKVCDGAGQVVDVPDDLDLPPDDGTICTVEMCQAGAATIAKASPGLACESGGTCTSDGTCGPCVNGAVDCKGNTPRTCVGGVMKEGGSCSSISPVCSSGACVTAVALGAGEAHTCAVLSDGKARCWGDNAAGQLGVGSADQNPHPSPMSVVGTSGLTKVRLGAYHTCALLGGQVACGGYNGNGQLGISIGDSTGSLLGVGLPETVVDLSAGYQHSCAVGQSGELWCWGGNDWGQLGTLLPGKKLAPEPASVAPEVVGVAAGGYHSCAVSLDGMVRCWGRNGAGQLGIGSVGDTTGGATAKVVPGVAGAVQVAVGEEHSCALCSSGEVFCWGGSKYGQVGVPGAVLPAPVSVPLPPAAEIRAGKSFTCARLASGGVSCWGANESGQLGPSVSGQSVAKPNLVPGAEAAVELVAGSSHACARLTSGGVLCWGNGQRGQLGSGSTLSTSVPTLVSW